MGDKYPSEVPANPSAWKYIVQDVSRLPWSIIKALSEQSVVTNTRVQRGRGSGSTLNLCTVALVQLSIFVEVTQTA